jgi:ABC-2 type transport system ATP-binding protein
LLFLDEPTANLDPEASKTVRDFILELKKEKRTIFLNTHNLDEAQRICDRIGIIKTKLLAVGTLDKLRERQSGRRTIFQVDRISELIVAAAKKLGMKNVEVEGNKLTIDVIRPEKENPDIVEAILSVGGRVESISEVSPSLEDIYLKMARS